MTKVEIVIAGGLAVFIGALDFGMGSGHSVNAPPAFADPISMVKDYRSWTLVNKRPVFVAPWFYALCAAPVPRQQLVGHEGGYINVYVNDVGKKAFLDPKGILPVGTIVVKEKSPGIKAKPVLLTVMIKRESKGSASDWQYIALTGDVTKELASDPKCIGCHRDARSDHLFRTYLKQPAGDIISQPLQSSGHKPG